MEVGTRLAILRAAERLFADRGFGVSLREIGIGAEQRNHSAVQYHFGTKQRLAEALFAYRMGPINEHRMDLIQQLRDGGREKDLAALADALVRPLADYVVANRGTSAYARFTARLMLSGFRPEPLRAEYTEGLGIVASLLSAARPDLTEERISLVNLYFATAMASLERRCEDPAFSDEQARRVVAEAVAGVTAMLSAPPA